MTYALGIDIGTTYTAAAVWRDGVVETVALGTRADVVPSVVLLREDGELLVGEAAVRRAVVEPERVAREFKRRIGDRVPVILAGEPFEPERLMAGLIRWVVDRVTEREGAEPAHVTLTCPANWGTYRRDLMQQAAREAGLTDAGLLEEPVAAAVHYAAQQRVEPGSFVGVYDLGGGTFDAAVLRKTDDGFDVHGPPGGDDRLGGADFDQAVLAHVASTLGDAWTQLDLADAATARAVSQVRANAVEAKEALSSDVDAGVAVILPGASTEVRLTRSEFEGAVRLPLQRTVDAFGQVIRAAGLEPSDLRNVLLVGGSSRIPLVSQLLGQQLRVQVALDAHPKYAVCLGAAIVAGTRIAAETPAATSAEVSDGDGGAATAADAADETAEAPFADDTVEPPAAATDGDDTGARVDLTALRVDLADSGLTRPLDDDLVGTSEDRPAVDPDATAEAAPGADPGDDTAQLDAAETDQISVADDEATATVRIPGRSEPADDATQPVSAAATDGFGAPERRARRRSVLTGAIVAAVVLVAVVGVFLARPSGDAASVAAAPTPTPTPAATPTPASEPAVAASPSPSEAATPTAAPSEPAPLPGFDLASLEWTDVTPQPFDDTDARVHAVTAATDGFVAVGTAGPDAFAMRSADGERWEEIDLPPADGPAAMFSVIDSPLGVVGGGVVGSRPDGDAAVWVDIDGDVVLVAPEELGGAGHQEIRDVLWDGDRLIAVGCTDDGTQVCDETQTGGQRATVWTSPDGRNWTRVSDDRIDGENAAMWVIEQIPDGYLAVGHEQTAGEASRRAAFWTSPDAETWTRVEVPAAHDDVESSALGIAVGDDGIVVVGYDDGTAPGTNKNAVMWFSRDGTEWQPSLPEPEDPLHQVAVGVVAVPDGFVAVGRDRESQANRGAVWTSDDGRDWTREDPDLFPEDDTQLRTAAVTGDGLLVGGHVVRQGPLGVRLWMAPPAPAG